MRALLERLRPWAPLALRLMLAVIFVWHGWERLYGRIGFQPFAKEVTELGLPRWSAHFAAWGQLVGGGLMALGFMTRIAGLACGVVVGVAVFKVHLRGGLGGLEFPLLCLAACLSLALSGAGKLSIDHKLFG